MAVETILQVSGLQVEYTTPSGPVWPVRGVSFSVGRGEVLGIVGESGSGKSATALALLKMLGSKGKISADRLELQGRDLTRCSEREMQSIRGRQIAMVFQDPMASLNPLLTAGRQITEVLQTHLRLSNEQAHDRAKELISLVEIGDPERRLTQYPHEFSGGMRQRLVLAIALACNPAVLIADEPTSSLDVTIQAQVLELISRLGRELGMAIVLITHDFGVVAGYADRVAVMYAGRIVEEARTGELFANPRMPYTIGLLQSVLRLDTPIGQRLVPIPGVPKSAARSPVTACPFLPRCRHAVDACSVEEPPLRLVSPGHSAACVLAGGMASALKDEESSDVGR